MKLLAIATTLLTATMAAAAPADDVQARVSVSVRLFFISRQIS